MHNVSIGHLDHTIGFIDTIVMHFAYETILTSEGEFYIGSFVLHNYIELVTFERYTLTSLH